jgi:hypothetical protein
MPLLFIKVYELNISSIFLDKRPDACLYDLFDHGDTLTIIIIDLSVLSRQLLREQGLVFGVVVRDGG